jgi:hypothetical protein
MKRKLQNKFFCVVVLGCAFWGTQTYAQEIEEVAPDNRTTSAPPTLNGQGPSLAFASEKTHTNYLAGGFAVTDSYTDNATLTTVDPRSDFSYLIQPYLRYTRSTPQMDWDVNLGAGVIFDQHLPQENEFAKNVGVDLTYRFSPYYSLRLSETFTDTTGLFSISNPGSLSSGIGSVEQSNGSVLVPLNQRTVTNSTLAELSYQLTPYSTIGVRGSFSILDYPGSPQNTQIGTLYDTNGYLGEVFYNRRISWRQWIGVSFRAQKFDTAISSTDTATVLLYYSVKVAQNATLSLFAGPEYYNSPQILAVTNLTGLYQGHQWTSAEGATLSWQRDRTSIALTFSRQLSDGGGLYPAVTLTLANATMRRQLSKNLEAKVGFTYSSNDPLALGNSYHGTSALFELQQRFGRGFMLRAGYAHEQQQWPNIPNLANANITWVSFSYGFSRVLGN